MVNHSPVREPRLLQAGERGARVRTWHKVLLVTVVLGLPTVVLGQMIWPSPSDGPEPNSGQLGLFVGLSLFDALAWGLGIAWLLFALPRLRRIAGGSEWRAWAMYLSIGWALGSGGDRRG